MKGFSKIFFIISCHLAFNLFGQITPNGNTGATTTSYTNGATDDPLYIWVANGVGNNTASLTATPPSGTGPFTFDWFYHNSANSSWTSYFSETTATTSTIATLPSDGYRVQIYDGSNNLIGCYTAWVWNMNADVTIADAATACDGTDLTGTINTEGTFTYFNPPPPESLITAATDISVCFSATHTWISDLAFYLVGPPSCGSPVILLSPNPGAIGQGSTCNMNNNVSNLCFSTTSSSVLDMCSAPSNVTGSYGLYGPGAGTTIDWSALYGCNAAAGGWSVQIYDCISQDTGTLTGSDVTFSNLTSYCGSPTSISYSSGVISSAINDNSCSAGTASIFQVPVATDLTTPIVANATTTYLWTADNGVSVPNPSSSLTPSLTGLAAGITNFTLTTTLEYNGISGTVDDVFAFTNTCCSAVADAGLDVSFCSNSSSQIGSASQVGYTYLWSPTTGLNDPTLAQPTVTLTNGTASNTTSTYTLTATNVAGGGCSTTDDVVVTVFPLPTVGAGVDQTLCDDGTSVTLSGSGASSYSWDNGITDGVSFSPSVGTTTYTVTGTDANNCINTDQVDVIVNALPTLNAGVDQTVCSGTTITLSGSGASSYAWDNGVTDGVGFTQAVGTITYTVTGTDANNCINTDQVDVTVQNGAPIDAGLDVSICDGASTTLTATGGVSYTWDNGLGAGATFVVSPTTTTTYNVTGTDANSCTGTDAITVTVNSLPTVNAGVDQTLCDDGTAVTLSGSGAVSYTWDNGVTDGASFSPTVGTTTYTVTGTDVNNCTNTDQVDVIINALPSVNAGLDQTVCTGTTITLSGGGAASYTWDNGVTDGVGFTQALGTITYTVAGTDANSCINTDQVDVTVQNGAPIDAGLDVSICDGASTTLTATGGVSYTWDNGLGAGATFVVSPTTTTTYNVTGTDANSCTGTDAITVTVNSLPTVNAGLDQTLCDDGTSVTLSGSGAVSYTWDNAVTDGVSFSPTVGTTTYTVTGTDANNCTNTDQVDVTINALPTVDAGIDQTVCTGTTITLSGSGAVSYAWDNGVTDGVGFTQAIGTITYTVTGTDANSCVNTDQVDVTVQNGAPIDAGLDVSICDGASTTLTATGGVSYTWDNGLGAGATFVVSPTTTTTYNVTGTDANSCTGTDAITVTVNSLPTVNAGVDQTLCDDGTAVTLSGSGAISYTWDNGVTDGVSFSPTVGTTTYTITGTDANNCTNTDQVDVIINALPVVNAGLDQTVCTGTTITLSGSGATSYAWDNGVTDGVGFTQAIGTITYTVTGTDANSCVNTDQVDVTVQNGAPIDAGLDVSICDGASTTLTATGGVSYTWDNGLGAGATFVVSPTTTTTYNVTGTDANSCTGTDAITVTVNSLPTVNAGVDQTLCDDGTAVTLSGSGAVSYTWDNSVTDGVSFSPTVGTITYTVTGTDANNCTNTDQVDVIINALPVVNAGPDQIVCSGDYITLSGSGAVSYTWDNSVTDGVSFRKPIGNITYTVTGIDINNCSNTDQVDVMVNSLPNVNAGTDQLLCDDGTTVTLTGSGASNYVWDNGVIDGVSFTQAVGVVTYTLTGTDANNCSNSDQVIVTVNALPTIDAGLDQTLCDDGTAVTLSASGAISYTWDNVVIDGVSFSPTVGTTTYTVTGTDANNCINSDQVDVIVNPLPIVDAGLNQTLCDDGTAVILSGIGAISYIWDNGVTDGVSFSPTVGITTYSVTGTDFNSCSNSDQVDVTVNPLPIVNAGADQPLVCEGDSVLLYGSGANSYTWDNNVIDSLKFIQSVGTVTYNVIGTDINGCENNDQVLVTVNPLPSFTLVNPQAVCSPELVDLTDGNLITSPIETLSYFIDSMSFQALISPDSVASGGIYYIKNTSSFGCEYILPVEVEIYDKPIASFFSSPSTLTNYNPSASMVNTSVGGMDYEWFFDDGETSNEINPTKLFDYTSIGDHEIVLIVTSGDMCKDTSSLVVEMQEKLLYYIPNTFTPNKDQFNNVFLPVFTAGFDPYDFTMLIFNRWGELVFESHNSDIGWDGSYNGNLMSDGVYLYKIEFVEKENNKTHIETGQLMLIK